MSGEASGSVKWTNKALSVILKLNYANIYQNRKGKEQDETE